MTPILTAEEQMVRLWAYDAESNHLAHRINAALLSDNLEELSRLMPLIRILNAYINSKPTQIKSLLYHCGSYSLDRVCLCVCVCLRLSMCDVCCVCV